RLLTAYDWPGNVRQLENAIFRAVVLADGDMLGVEEFPQIAALAGPLPGAPVADALRLTPGRPAGTVPAAPRQPGGPGWSPGPNGFGA
ncbi:hypothetical protein J8J27_30145, partial [Mycobacterium tuberculosis]|nr:hypothetical protein [Mycobacterium tuberculosis]